MEAVDPTLAFRDFQLLKLKYDQFLSSFGFNCKQRPCTAVALTDAWIEERDHDIDLPLDGRPLQLHGPHLDPARVSTLEPAI